MGRRTHAQLLTGEGVSPRDLGIRDGLAGDFEPARVPRESRRAYCQGFTRGRVQREREQARRASA